MSFVRYCKFLKILREKKKNRIEIEIYNVYLIIFSNHSTFRSLGCGGGSLILCQSVMTQLAHMVIYQRN